MKTAYREIISIKPHDIKNARKKSGKPLKILPNLERSIIKKIYTKNNLLSLEEVFQLQGYL